MPEDAAPHTGIDFGRRPIVAPGVASVELDGEVVVLDTTGHVHLLNPTAAVLWAWFDGRATLEEIAADAADAFHAPYLEVLADVRALALALAASGLLAMGPDAPVRE